MKKTSILALALIMPLALSAAEPSAPVKQKNKKAPATPTGVQKIEIPLKERLHNVLGNMVTKQEQLNENLESAKKLGPKTTGVALEAYLESLQLISNDISGIKKELLDGFKQKDTPEDTESIKMARAVTAYAENLSKTAGEIKTAVSAYAAGFTTGGKKQVSGTVAQDKKDMAVQAEKAAATLEKTCKQLQGAGKWFEAALK